jgi:hypothetical protein
MTCKKYLVLALAVAAGFVLPAAAGTVTGTVKFEGKAPEMKPLRVPESDVCIHKHGGPIINEALVLGEGQTMANIIVRVIKGLPDGKSYPVPQDSVTLDQKGCKYTPHVFVLQTDQYLLIKNPDGIFHNVHAECKVNDPLNLAMPADKTREIHSFPKAEDPFPITCDVHPWMMSFCAVVDHPFWDITEKDGKFTIEGLEPGTYTIEAWHEKLGPRTAEVTVEADGEQTVDFTFER